MGLLVEIRELSCAVNHGQDLAQFGGAAAPQQRLLVDAISRADSHNFAEVTDRPGQLSNTELNYVVEKV